MSLLQQQQQQSSFTASTISWVTSPGIKQHPRVRVRAGQHAPAQTKVMHTAAVILVVSARCSSCIQGCTADTLHHHTVCSCLQPPLPAAPALTRQQDGQQWYGPFDVAHNASRRQAASVLAVYDTTRHTRGSGEVKTCAGAAHLQAAPVLTLLIHALHCRCHAAASCLSRGGRSAVPGV